MIINSHAYNFAWLYRQCEIKPWYFLPLCGMCSFEWVNANFYETAGIKYFPSTLCLILCHLITFKPIKWVNIENTKTSSIIIFSAQCIRYNSKELRSIISFKQWTMENLTPIFHLFVLCVQLHCQHNFHGMCLLPCLL